MCKVQWELLLQQFNACGILERSNNDYINAVRDLKADKERYLSELNICNQTSLPSAKDVRRLLQEKEYNNWCQLKTHGRGVVLYEECTSANRWITSSQGLSSSEWREAIKLQGRSPDGTRCRHCNETETLAHVLGSSQYEELLRNTTERNKPPLKSKSAAGNGSGLDIRCEETRTILPDKHWNGTRKVGDAEEDQRTPGGEVWKQKVWREEGRPGLRSRPW